MDTLFKKRNKGIEAGVVEAVYGKFKGITLYMHRTMNELFNMTSEGETCYASDIDIAIEHILAEGHEGYTALYYQLSDKQRALVLALAKEGVVREINSAAFIRRNNLPTQSTLSAVVKQLLDRDIITKELNLYFVYDHFFALWLRNRILSIDLHF